MSSISKPNQPSPFPTTQWTLVLQSQSPEEAADQALDALCRAYWLPVHGWIWRQVGQKEEAEDLTQAYFHDLLQRDYHLAGADDTPPRLRHPPGPRHAALMPRRHARQRTVASGGIT